MDIDDGSTGEGDNGEAPVEQQQEESSPPPAVHSTARMPPAGSGARLSFLLGVQPSPSTSKVGGARGGLPPTAATGSGRKRGRAPVASSSDGDSQVQKKAKNRAAGDKQAQKDKSLVGTSPSSQAAQTPSESVNEISDDEDEVEEVNAAAATRATRRLTSDVWLEMKEFVGGEWKGICNYCHKGLSAKSKSGTSHLRDHLKVCTLRQLKLNSKTGKSLSQSSLRMTAQSDGKVTVETYTFDQETAREELGNMIVLHDYPLSIVDNAGFRRKDIIGRHDKEKSKAIEYMTMLQSRIAVTTDMWTADSQKKGYMAVTGHFVDESWKLRSMLMGFIYVPAPHTGDAIAEELHNTLMQWNLDEKLMTVTVDNCTSNDRALELLVGKIGKSKLPLEGTMLHMRCCAHILNLIVKDGLDAMKSATHNIRESVAYWTASTKRVEKFEEMARYKKVKITNKLRLDCKTRWNSVFIMLNTALPYRVVFERAKVVDKQYANLPTSEEWDFAVDIVPRLSLFYEITTLFSGRDYVTANVFFPKICEIKMKIRQWTTSKDLVIQIMCENMIQKFDKYWIDIQGLMGIATLLDPRYKRQMLVACYAMLHGIEPSSYECNDKVDAVVANLQKLIKEYEVEEDEYQSVGDSSLSSMPAPAIMSFFHDIVAQQRPAAARVQGEIEHYLADDLVPYTEKFDVLDWWKVAGTRYPTLRKLARDIFAIPVTTVASESAFSMSGRIVNDHRSRLTSKMLEVLMCYQNWLRNKYKDAHMGEGSFWTCLQDTQEENEDSCMTVI